MVVMSSGFALTMAPATESIMGSLPLAKAGVGSAVNDTTRQVGGALGVAVLGSIFTSIYSSRLTSSLAGQALPAGVVTQAKDSVGTALQVANDLGGTAGRALANAARSAFINGLSAGLRLGTAVVLVAVFVAWRSCPPGPTTCWPWTPCTRTTPCPSPAPRPSRAWPARLGVDVGAVVTAPAAGPPPRGRGPHPAGRDARADRAILEATLDLVGETGLAGSRWMPSRFGPASARRPSTGGGPPRRPWCWRRGTSAGPSSESRHGLPATSSSCAHIRDGLGTGVMEHVFPTCWPRRG
jgi:hypothetical protein